MAYERFTDAEIMVAVNAAPDDVYSKDAWAARLLGCITQTVARRRMKIEQPKAYAKWLKRNQEHGFKRRGTDHLKKHRRTPVVPTTAEIKVALKATNGDCWKAARILGCSKTPVRNFVLTERAAGRNCGRYRVITSNEIERVVDVPDTRLQFDPEDKVLAALIEHMGDELAEFAA
jgi:hypothetical protein